MNEKHRQMDTPGVRDLCKRSCDYMCPVDLPAKAMPRIASHDYMCLVVPPEKFINIFFINHSLAPIFSKYKVVSKAAIRLLIFFLIRLEGELKFIHRLPSFFLFTRKLQSNFEPSFLQGYQLLCLSCHQAHGPFAVAGNCCHCLYKLS